jgi:4-amino-4-deoxy-L-arabinose transferase-like glycosyltransferase
MESTTKTRLRAGIAWLLIVCACFLFLGSRGLNEPDEGRYAEIGREMAVSGQWLLPHLNGFPHFQKPPLLYWFTAASFNAFGQNEWAARLPSTLAALGTLVLTFWMTRSLLGRSAAWCATLVLLSSLEFFALARTLTPDMLMTFWITAALASLVHVHNGGHAIWRWAFFGAMGMGFCTKGPMAFVVPMCGALGMQFAARRNGLKLSLPWGRGLLVSLMIGLSWFITLAVTSHELFYYFWHYELLERFASKAHGRSQPLWFFIPVVLIGFMPWTWFLPPLLRDAWRRLRHGALLSPLHGLLLGWIVPPLIILSFSGSKLLTYVLPLFPALAVLIAWWRERRGFPLSRAALWAGGAVLIYLTAFSQLPRFNDRLGQQASVRPLIDLLKRQPDFSVATVFASEIRVHGVEFYLGHPIAITRGEADVVLPTTEEENQRLFDTPEACEQAMSQQVSAYGILRAKDATRHFPPARWRVLGSAGGYVLITKTP